MDVTRIAEELLDWFARNARDLPWRRTSDPYGIWISEIMLQQTQVKTVIPFWERWLRELPDVPSLAGAAEERVLKLWEGLGYYRRARNLRAAAQQIVERHHGRFPTAPADILALPGVGRYTAGAIGSIAFNRPEPILDGNVVRVLTRLGALPGDPRRPPLHPRLWESSTALVEAADRTRRPKACSHLNQALMELGATVCLPRRPACGQCPVQGNCRAHALGRVESFPGGPVRAPATPRYYVVIVAHAAGRYCVRRRGSAEVNGGLWEFPNAEVESATVPAAAFAREWFGKRGGEPAAWCAVRHAITRYKVTQVVHRLEVQGRPKPGLAGEWRTLEELEELAFSSAHRRIVHRLRAASGIAHDLRLNDRG